MERGGGERVAVQPSTKLIADSYPPFISFEQMEGDEWRPTPEEYKKLSSKEKRQLRNKIVSRFIRSALPFLSRNRLANQLSFASSPLETSEFEERTRSARSSLD